MSNLPDNITQADIDHATAEPTGSHYDELIALFGKMERILSATVDAYIKNRMLISRSEFDGIVEGITESFVDHTDEHIRELDDQGYDFYNTPDDFDKTKDAEYERLVDAFRVKKIDYSGILFDSQRPCPTNPATLAAIGGDNE